MTHCGLSVSFAGTAHCYWTESQVDDFVSYQQELEYVNLRESLHADQHTTMEAGEQAVLPFSMLIPAGAPHSVALDKNGKNFVKYLLTATLVMSSTQYKDGICEREVEVVADPAAPVRAASNDTLQLDRADPLSCLCCTGACYDLDKLNLSISLDKCTVSPGGSIEVSLHLISDWPKLANSIRSIHVELVQIWTQKHENVHHRNTCRYPLADYRLPASTLPSVVLTVPTDASPQYTGEGWEGFHPLTWTYVISATVRLWLPSFTPLWNDTRDFKKEIAIDIIPESPGCTSMVMHRETQEAIDEEGIALSVLS